MGRDNHSGLFKKGNKGKPKGALNKENQAMRTVKQCVLETFNKIQEDPKQNLEAFAKNYPKDFYQIAAKLIPTELDAKINVKKIGAEASDESYV